MRLIAIIGGIGAGKSVVSDVVRALGYPVYDCDRRARAIMDESNDIKQALMAEITPQAIDDEGNINRGAIAEIVFNDRSKLARLNSIVHAAVRQDLSHWCQSIESSPTSSAIPVVNLPNPNSKFQIPNSNLAFVETAILVESGLDKMVDVIWAVVAPDDLRIQRVMHRNGLTCLQVEARIASQSASIPTSSHIIHNDGGHSLLLQIHSHLSSACQPRLL